MVPIECLAKNGVLARISSHALEMGYLKNAF